SGRGVGMDVVRRHVERLGGRVAVKSEPGVGSAVQIALPLTLLLTRSLLVEVDGSSLAIPEHHVADVLCCTSEAIDLRPEGPVLSWRDRLIPFQHLSEALAQRRDRHALDAGLTVVVHGGGLYRGFRVDALKGLEETLVQSLSPYAGAAPPLAGAALLRRGEIAFVLDVPALIGGGPAR
ncbi:MAG TPA: chemotaxis protein CheW, partial [Limnochordia bacterium]